MRLATDRHGLNTDSKMLKSHYDKRDEAALLNELKATSLKVGMLVNFGRSKVEYKRQVF